MTDQEYRDILDTLTAFARSYVILTSTISDGDLAVAAETVERASAFGPFIDPTKYRERLQDGGLDRQRKLIASARAFRKAIAETFPTDPVLCGLLTPAGEAEAKRAE